MMKNGTSIRIKKDAVTVMIHCGSRGLGHQTCTDYVRIMIEKLPSWGYQLPDRELVCAPFSPREGQQYFAGHDCCWQILHGQIAI